MVLLANPGILVNMLPPSTILWGCTMVIMAFMAYPIYRAAVSKVSTAI